MLRAIAIPAEVSIVAVATALATINLRAVHGYHAMMTFEHGAGPIPPALCDVSGCDRLATAKEGLRTICARHWIAARTGV